MSESIWNDPRITAYVLDELPGDERMKFEQEMNSNAELAAAVAEASGVTSRLGELYIGEATPPLDAARREAILAAEANSPVQVPTAQASSRLPLAIMATAASLLILLGLAPWMAERTSKVAMENAQRTISETGSASDREVQEQKVVRALGDKFVGEEEEAEALAATSEEGFSEAEMLGGDLSSPGQSGAKESTLAGESRQFAKDRGAIRVDAAKRLSMKTDSGRLSGSDEAAAKNEQIADSYAYAVDANSAGIQIVEDEELVEDEEQGQTRYTPSTGVADAPVGEALMQQIDVSGKLASDSSAGDLGVNPGKPAEVSLSKKVAETRGGKIRALESSRVQNQELNRGLMSQDNDADGENDFLDVIAPAAMPAIAAAPFSGPDASIAMGRDAAKAKYARGSQISGGRNIVSPRVVSNGTVRLHSALPLSESQQRLAEVDFGEAKAEGVGPGKSGDQFDPITDNAFKRVAEHPLSTFSVDVDTASYSKTRDFVMRANQLPRPDAVRIEELLNYFDYDYAGPDADADHPFAARAVVTGCPWNEEHRLARIAIKGKEMDASERPKCNLVFLLDTSGSMNASNKLPLVVEGMQMLLGRLNKKDRVAIAVYAGSAGLVLDSTKVGKNGKEIKNALARLSAGGSTNGGAGIELAYRTARENFISDGVNRVILCTDGDFNVGTTGTDALVRMVEQEAKGGVFLSVLGFGMGNHNDAMLEKVSGRGNGNYAFIDTKHEARKVLVDQTSATLVTIAKDVKLQIEFNPSRVSSYRLIGYENRILAKEDFNDDKKDAGEIGAGHEVTALYEIVPAGVETDEIAPTVDPLKYQTKLKQTNAADSDEMVTVKLRYKQPDGDKSTLVEFPVLDDGESFDDADADVRFAASVAGFGMQLRRSEYKGDWTMKDVLSVARNARGEDEFGLRAEFIDIVRKATELMGAQ